MVKIILSLICFLAIASLFRLKSGSTKFLVLGKSAQKNILAASIARVTEC